MGWLVHIFRWLMRSEPFRRRGLPEDGWQLWMSIAGRAADVACIIGALVVIAALVTSTRARRRKWGAGAPEGHWGLPMVFVLFFGAFALARAGDYLMWIYPARNLDTVVRLLLAVAAVVMALAVPPLILTFVDLPSADALKRTNEMLQRQIEQKRAEIAKREYAESQLARRIEVAHKSLRLEIDALVLIRAKSVGIDDVKPLIDRLVGVLEALA